MEIKTIANVKSPARNTNYKTRNGNGFSLSEIKQAGKTIQAMKTLGIKIDYFRKSTNQSNVKKLKAVKDIEKAKTKREPFVKKEKKSAKFKPEPVKKKRKKPTSKTPPKKKITIKSKTPVKKIEKEKTTIKTLKKEDIKIDATSIQKEPGILTKKQEKKNTGGTALTALTGLGITTAKKFESVGVNSIEELIKENPEELAKLVKGASAVRISTWIKEGQKLLEESK